MQENTASIDPIMGATARILALGRGQEGVAPGGWIPAGGCGPPPANAVHRTRNDRGRGKALVVGGRDRRRVARRGSEGEEGITRGNRRGSRVGGRRLHGPRTTQRLEHRLGVAPVLAAAQGTRAYPPHHATPPRRWWTVRADQFAAGRAPETAHHASIAAHSTSPPVPPPPATPLQNWWMGLSTHVAAAKQRAARDSRAPRGERQSRRVWRETVTPTISPFSHRPHARPFLVARTRYVHVLLQGRVDGMR